MVAFSNMGSAKGAVKEGGFGSYRPNTQKSDLQSDIKPAKPIVEEYEISLDNDFGTDGRPRVKEEIKLPPQYESIDLNDTNDEVLF